MPFAFFLQAAAAAVTAASTNEKKRHLVGKTREYNNAKKTRNLQGKGSKTSDDIITTLWDITTFHKYHHFGLFFVMVHDDTVGPLFTPNVQALDGFAFMCEAGDASELVTEFTGQPGVFSVEQVPAVLFGQQFFFTDQDVSDPLFAIGTLELAIDVPEDYPLVTIVAMIANSNDGCIILDGVNPQPDTTYEFIEIDVGTEANTEACGDIGGCAGIDQSNIDNCPCEDMVSQAVNTGPEGELFMSYHDGLGGINSALVTSDWRAHMVAATVSWGLDD